MDETPNRHRELVVRAIKVYQLLGHAVEEVTPIDQTRTDLKVRSNEAELWIVRCETSESIDAESVRSFIVSCSIHGPQQLALLTTGQIQADARTYVEGHPIHLVDEALLREYQVRAERRLIEKALSPVSIPEGVGIEPEQPPAPTLSESQRTRCPYCGEENLAGSIVCASCSRNLVVTSPLSLDGKQAAEDAVPEPMFSST
jgi:DNA-directed RNA polymerase subunit RPC12/RpoP